MVRYREIKGRDVFASSTEVGVRNDAGDYVMGNWVVAYSFDLPPGMMVSGTPVKGANKKTAIFPNADAAIDAAFAAAEAALP